MQLSPRGLAVTSAPGASAVPMALALSGLPTDRFFFGGFLPAKEGERRRAIGAVASLPATLVFFEAPHRLAASLADLAELLGARPAAVARELTKLFEEVRRASLVELAAHYASHPDVKGEIAIVIGAPGEEAGAAGRRARRGTAHGARRRFGQGCSGGGRGALWAEAPRRLCPRARASTRGPSKATS